MRAEVDLIAQKVQAARDRGAYKCAARELAIADANLEFLNYELEEGDFRRADWHYRNAFKYAERALEITDPATCVEPEVLMADSPQLVIERTDRDQDTVLDDVDQCPDEREDLDKFQDDDGCPDPDNDGDIVPDAQDQCPLVAGDPDNDGCPLADRDHDGVPDEIDHCPDKAEDLDGHEDKDGCPEEENADGDLDGLPNLLDSCPTDAEDFDSYQDDDGCPDPDNDEDGIADASDLCPIQPGTLQNAGCPLSDRDGDGVTDDLDACPDVPGGASGCPARVLVEKKDGRIEIKKQIHFESGTARITGRLSDTIIDQVAAVMKSNPAIHVVIEGHTDAGGAAAYNLTLSDDRAKAVRAALISLGVDGQRLRAIGYGESKPLGSNATERGRAGNRRVEFKIVKGE
jgi:outer membrane protein OmpA-like peptidoglycan-associated protein